jgi:hypothetical protein
MATLKIEPDGVSAASGDLTMRLDGDVLTVEALNPESEECAGVYEKR